jgi:hypothetical protein
VAGVVEVVVLAAVVRSPWCGRLRNRSSMSGNIICSIGDGADDKTQATGSKGRKTESSSGIGVVDVLTFVRLAAAAAVPTIPVGGGKGDARAHRDGDTR